MLLKKTLLKYGKIFGILLSSCSHVHSTMIANAGSLFNTYRNKTEFIAFLFFTIIRCSYYNQKGPPSAAKIAQYSQGLCCIFLHKSISYCKGHFGD